MKFSGVKIQRESIVNGLNKKYNKEFLKLITKNKKNLKIFLIII